MIPEGLPKKTGLNKPFRENASQMVKKVIQKIK